MGRVRGRLTPGRRGL